MFVWVVRVLAATKSDVRPPPVTMLCRPPAEIFGDVDDICPIGFVSFLVSCGCEESRPRSGILLNSDLLSIFENNYTVISDNKN